MVFSNTCPSNDQYINRVWVCFFSTGNTPLTDLSKLSCSFDTPAICGYTIQTVKGAPWKWVGGSMSRKNLGPLTDYTTQTSAGMLALNRAVFCEDCHLKLAIDSHDTPSIYLGGYMAVPYPTGGSITTTLTSPVMQNNGSVCITLAYSITGGSLPNGGIKIFLKDPTAPGSGVQQLNLWFNVPSGWHKSQVTIK